MSDFTDAMRKQIPRFRNMTDEEILTEAKNATGYRGSQRAFNVSIGEQPRTTGSARMAQVFGQGASAGWGDELAGLFAPVLQPAIAGLDIATGGMVSGSDGLDAAYKNAKMALDGQLSRDVMQVARGEIQMAREDAPMAATGAELGGGLASAMATGAGLGRLGSGIAQRAPGLGAAIQAVGQASTPAARIAGGAMGGGLYGAGAANDGDRLRGAGEGALLGGIIPPAVSGAGKLGVGAAKLAARVSPTGHALRAAAGLLAPPGMKMAARDLVTLGTDVGKAVEKAANSPIPGRVAGAAERVVQATPEQRVMQANASLGGRAGVEEIAAATGLTEQEVAQASRNIILENVPGAKPPTAPPLPPMRPPPAPTPPAAPMSLDSFAKTVNEAAKKTPTRYSPRDAFISGVWNDVKDRLGMTEAQFKQKLLEAHRAGKLHLARADLVGAMDPEAVAASETKLGDMATFHFVVTPDEAAAAAAAKASAAAKKRGKRRK